jgi:Putative inner membrane protein (DUF1819)
MYQLAPRKYLPAIGGSQCSVEHVFVYKAHTKFPFLLTESIVMARLVKEGLSDEEIRHRVVDLDLLQIRSRSSREGALRMLKHLLSMAPTPYIEFLVEGNHDLRRYTLLFLTFRVNRFLRDVSSEFLLYKLRSLDVHVSKKSLQAFFEIKREQEPVIHQWSSATYQKVCSNTILTLVRSGLLTTTSIKGIYEIKAMPIPIQLKQQLLNDELEFYLKLMLN